MYLEIPTVFFPDLFNLYIDSVLKELETMQEFIIGGCNLKIQHADDTVWMTDSKRKLQNIIDNVVEENEKRKRTNPQL